MPMTALQIVQQVCAWQALPIPSALFSATDPQTVELRGLLNEEVLELKKWPDAYWRKLLRQHTFTSTATEVQPSTALPDDLEYIVPTSMWDRTMARPCIGPITPQQWQAIIAQPIVASYAWYWRLRGADFLTAPNPPAGDTVAYEYISNLAVYSGGDTASPPGLDYFENDSDTAVFDGMLMARGVRWRFLSQKKLDYTQEYAMWVGLVQREVSRSKGMPVLNAAGPSLPGLDPWVPSQSWPGP